MLDHNQHQSGKLDATKAPRGSNSKLENDCGLVPFAKYSGCGNDFLLIDNRTLQLPPIIKGIQHLCHRQHGIGADGLIFLEKPKHHEAAYRMRIFNADGSEAEMCGNGLRCLARHISTLENSHESFMIETMHQCMRISFNKENALINISMPPPNAISLKKITINEHELLLHCLNTGVPHAVLFTDDIENETLFSLAPSIRFHQEFQPHGTNVNFAKILPDQSVSIRTYERGVEGETLACGTGATATAVAFANISELPFPVKIHTRSGEPLYINFQGKIPHLTDLIMTGPAIKVFEGTVNCKMFGF